MNYFLPLYIAALFLVGVIAGLISRKPVVRSSLLIAVLFQVGQFCFFLLQGKAQTEPLFVLGLVYLLAYSPIPLIGALIGASFMDSLSGPRMQSAV